MAEFEEQYDAMGPGRLLGADGPGEFDLERVNIDRLILDPENTREHDEASISTIKRLLLKFGQRVALVAWRASPDDEMGQATKDGNGRLMAIRELVAEGRTGWQEVWVHWADGFTKDEADALQIALNQSPNLSTWNYQRLSSRMKSLPQELRGFTGFDPSSVSMLMQGEWKAGETKTPLPGATPEMGAPVRLTQEQRAIVERAIAKVRNEEGEQDISEGRCLEFIAAEFLS